MKPDIKRISVTTILDVLFEVFNSIYRSLVCLSSFEGNGYIQTIVNGVFCYPFVDLYYVGISLILIKQ